MSRWARRAAAARSRSQLVGCTPTAMAARRPQVRVDRRWKAVVRTPTGRAAVAAAVAQTHRPPARVAQGSALETAGRSFPAATVEAVAVEAAFGIDTGFPVVAAIVEAATAAAVAVVGAAAAAAHSLAGQRQATLGPAAAAAFVARMTAPCCRP